MTYERASICKESGHSVGMNQKTPPDILADSRLAAPLLDIKPGNSL